MTKNCRKLPKFSYNQYGQKLPKSSKIDHFLSKILSKIDPNDQVTRNLSKMANFGQIGSNKKQACFARKSILLRE